MPARPSSHSIVTGYTLLVGALLFLWPVVLGIPPGPMRVAWVIAALVLLQWSSRNAERFLGRPTLTLPPLRAIPWIPTYVLLCVIAFPLVTIPFHSFSDEPHIALPTLTVLTRVAHQTGWVPLMALAAAALAAFSLASTRLSARTARIIVCLFAVVAIIAGTRLTPASPLALRYPPLVHVFQGLTTLTVQGDLSMLRLTNLLWTLLLVIVVAVARPQWNHLAQMGAVLGIVMTPLGWVYRTALYQACGEITLGMAAAFLLANVLEKKRVMVSGAESMLSAALLGLLLALWILYRPTSVVALGSILFVLVLLRRGREAWIVGGIAGPIALLWLALYPAYNYSFLLQQGSLFPAAERSLLEPIVQVIRTFPGSFHPLATAALVLGSLLVVFCAKNRERRLVAAAWIVAVPPILVQQMVLPPEFYGFPRYNALLLVPLGAVVGTLLAGQIRPPRLAQALGALCLLVLAYTTPWNLVLFMQRGHVDTSGLYQSVPGADIPLPIVAAVETELRRGVQPVVVSPDYTFLDLFIAQRLLTVEERRRIIETGMRWRPANPERPVLIQAPVQTSYQPNISAEDEKRLRDARAWALRQRRHEVLRLGLEETVIVP